jgi:hypothetical protein
MILKTISNGNITGTGTVDVESRKLGGVLITTDGTNAAVIILSNDTSTGEQVFDISTKQPLFVSAPISCSNRLYYNISGTGAAAQLFEWID